MEDERLIEIIENNEFVSVEFANGHEHTIKAYGVLNEWIGSENHEINNQLDYNAHVCENENTEIYDVRYSNSESEAKELEIIDEDGGFL